MFGVRRAVCVLGICALALVVGMCGTDPVPPECSQLELVCQKCTSASIKKTCDAAVASRDKRSCQDALNDAAIQAQCTPGTPTPTPSVFLRSLVAEPALIAPGESFTLIWEGNGGTVTLSRKDEGPFQLGLTASGSYTLKSGDKGYPSGEGATVYRAMIGDAVLVRETTVTVTVTCGRDGCQADRGENCSTCPLDCGCVSSLQCVAGSCVADCPWGSACTDGEACTHTDRCRFDNKTCAGQSYTCGTCQTCNGQGGCDLVSHCCGNGTCESGENCHNCHADCACTNCNGSTVIGNCPGNCNSYCGDCLCISGYDPDYGTPQYQSQSCGSC